MSIASEFLFNSLPTCFTSATLLRVMTKATLARSAGCSHLRDLLTSRSSRQKTALA